jgi:Protein phosphatase 2C
LVTSFAGADQASDLDMTVVEEAVVGAIEGARAKCLAIAQNNEQLSSFHATVVGVFMRMNNGVFFQIGDGGASAHYRAQEGIKTVAFSPPENGEYIDETYFFSGDRWKNHLRFTYFNAGCASVWLMTDGAYDLMVPPGEHQLRDFTEKEVTRLVFEEGSTGSTQVLEAILSGPQATSRNGDDKTLVIIRRGPQG